MTGLSATQIRKLTPGNGYTDKQLINITPKSTGKIVKGSNWWATGKGTMALFEDPPNDEEATFVKPEEASREFARIIVASSIRVYPVEVRENAMCKAKCVIRFSDGNGTSAWFDPKYVLAAINTRRAGKGKKAQSSVEFYTNNDPGMPTLYVKKNCHPIALLVGRKPPISDPDWSFRYTGDLQ